MRITSKELKKDIHKRLSHLKKDEVDKFFYATIKIIVGRFFKRYNTIIDNFGVLSRRELAPKKAFNVNSNKHQIITSDTIVLRPSLSFLLFFKDPINRKIILDKIIKKSENAIKKTDRKYLY